MSSIKIAILGNSVALRKRPVEKHPNNKNYGEFLMEELNKHIENKHIIIENRAIGAFTIYNAFLNIDNYINIFPDIFILNYGVVDASTRAIPLWFYRLATNKRDNFFYITLKLIYKSIIIKIRPFLVNIRFKRSWISLRKFKKYYSSLIKILIKETNAKIIALPINIANDRVEKQLPGSKKKHAKYNETIKKICTQNNQHYLESIENINSLEFYPDGVHFSVKGHQYVANKLREYLLSILD